MKCKKHSNGKSEVKAWSASGAASTGRKYNIIVTVPDGACSKDDYEIVVDSIEEVTDAENVKVKVTRIDDAKDGSGVVASDDANVYVGECVEIGKQLFQVLAIMILFAIKQIRGIVFEFPVFEFIANVVGYGAFILFAIAFVIAVAQIFWEWYNGTGIHKK